MGRACGRWWAIIIVIIVIIIIIINIIIVVSVAIISAIITMPLWALQVVVGQHDRAALPALRRSPFLAAALGRCLERSPNPNPNPNPHPHPDPNPRPLPGALL